MPDAATGVVYVHASPAAVCPHVEWALSSTLQARANLKWTPQPAMPGQLRAVTNWIGPVGTGASGSLPAGATYVDTYVTFLHSVIEELAVPQVYLLGH